MFLERLKEIAESCDDAPEPYEVSAVLHKDGIKLNVTAPSASGADNMVRSRVIAWHNVLANHINPVEIMIDKMVGDLRPFAKNGDTPNGR